eukprot:TRINITY_DN1035_c0_g1_i7.p1 TRINITY_DN1035_c0_g1~~TRINITY_DN1035_c0_g1_i7.p1  ORF type:complete len:576 (-),score=94.49 TRINITY_DN1035_c0_g1_i7:520-2247(-)
MVKNRLDGTLSGLASNIWQCTQPIVRYCRNSKAARKANLEGVKPLYGDEYEKKSRKQKPGKSDAAPDRNLKAADAEPSNSKSKRGKGKHRGSGRPVNSKNVNYSGFLFAELTENECWIDSVFAGFIAFFQHPLFEVQGLLISVPVCEEYKNCVGLEMALRVSEEFEQFVVRQPSDVRKWKKTVKAFRTYAWTTANQHGVDRGVFWSLISFVGFLIEDTFSVHLKSLAYFHRDLRAHCQKCNWEKVDNCVNFELLDLPVRPWNITFYAEEMVNDYVGLAGRRVGVNHDCKKCKANNSVIRMFRMMTMPKLLIIFIDVDGGRLDTPRYIHIRPTWHNGHEYKYELLTVFVHTGGHYVVYMHLKKPFEGLFYYDNLVNGGRATLVTETGIPRGPANHRPIGALYILTQYQQIQNENEHEVFGSSSMTSNPPPSELSTLPPSELSMSDADLDDVLTSSHQESSQEDLLQDPGQHHVEAQQQISPIKTASPKKLSGVKRKPDQLANDLVKQPRLTPSKPSPKETCVKCGMCEDDSTQAVWGQCDYCDRWVHLECVGVSLEYARKAPIFHCTTCKPTSFSQ